MSIIRDEGGYAPHACHEMPGGLGPHAGTSWPYVPRGLGKPLSVFRTIRPTGRATMVVTFVERWEPMDDDRCVELVERLLDTPCTVIDVLPLRVGAEGARRYAAFERHMLTGSRIRDLRERQASLLSMLGCYVSLAVSVGDDGPWEPDPTPAGLAAKLCACVPDAGRDRGYVRVLTSDRTLLTLDKDETHLSVYNLSASSRELMAALASSQGLFLW